MMKILKTLLLLSIIRTAALAQNCPDTFLGTKTLYPLPTKKYTPAPAGYTPVFINHVGRHGARHLTKEVKVAFAYQLLARADSAQSLTARGALLRQMILRLEKVEGVDVKSISDEGRNELTGIGSRMYTQYKSLFSNKVYLNIGVTKEIRTKQSADAFLAGLKKDFTTSPDVDNYNGDKDLRFYDIAPAYKAFEQNGPWKPVMEQLAKAEHMAQLNQALALRLFKPDFVAQLSATELEKFANDVFGFTTIVYSLPAEITKAGFTAEQLNFKAFFTCDELARLGKLDVADDFYKKGPGLNVNGIQVRIAVPLLVNFMKTTNEFIVTGKYQAQLRFAHAETIAPFAALLGISTADKATTDLSRINKDWQAAKVAPLASNIQWIMYKKGAGDYLVKVLLNEKEVAITGLKTKTYPYYKWADLKDFYIKKLDDYHGSIYDDMGKYLKEIAQ